MPTQVQIAKRWGVSAVRVFQLVKEGCPTSSYAAADKWRVARGALRPPTNAKTPEPKKPVPKSKSKSKLSKRMEVEPPPPEPRKKRAFDPAPEKTGDTITDTLNQIVYLTDRSNDNVIAAMEADSPSQNARMIEYCRMVEAKMKVEKTCREELVRRGTLVNQHDILATCRAALESVMKRLRRVAIELGPQCNPTDALMATKVLEREMESIMIGAAKVIRDLKPKSH